VPDAVSKPRQPDSCRSGTDGQRASQAGPRATLGSADGRGLPGRSTATTANYLLVLTVFPITAPIAMNQVMMPKIAPIVPYVLLSEMIVSEK
jgi:hypothetical protein